MFDNPATARSQTGFVIMYAGCPIFWKSCLQTLIMLSTTEAEFVALSHAMHVMIPLMHIINEMIQRRHPLNRDLTHVHCDIFEDNQGTIEMATVPKFFCKLGILIWHTITSSH